MDENRFWEMIEASWQEVGGNTKAQRAQLCSDDGEEVAYDLEESAGKMSQVLLGKLDALSAEDLLRFDPILERKLYDLDRQEIHEQTDGSDDGFLYCRGFIVAMGRKYYESVDANPEFAVLDAECEAMCYLSWHRYREKFGEVPNSDISRETASNIAGWES